MIVRRASCASPANRQKILLVDDQPANVRVMHELLGREYETVMTTDAREVVRLAEHEQPDLILLDNMMPHLNGLELCQRLQDNESTRRTPIIFITGQNEPETEALGLEAGVRDFISKPINPLVLQARVRTQLTLKAATDQLLHAPTIDNLTGIANRSSFDQRLDLEWRACLRDEISLGLILIDVDYFDAFNEYYGQRAGDEALHSIANVLGRSLRRPRDFLARYAGKAFACILPGSDLPQTLRTANYLGKRLEAAEICHEASPISQVVTISAGCGAQLPEASCKAGSLLRLAERQLDLAKEAGRDCVRGAQGESIAGSPA